ncbi:MAG: hypothetical protein ABIO53_12115 [Chitinophagaceae bacterium]
MCQGKNNYLKVVSRCADKLLTLTIQALVFINQKLASAIKWNACH